LGSSETAAKLGQNGAKLRRGWPLNCAIVIATTPSAIQQAIGVAALFFELSDSRIFCEKQAFSRPESIMPSCVYLGTCGGCSTSAPSDYAAWKRGFVLEALARVGLSAPVEALVDAHGAGRRRASFHARFASGPPSVGFMKARAHEVVEIAACPLLAPSMADALPAARALARVLASLGKPLDILVTATETGLDVDLRGAGPLAPGLTRRLAAQAQALGLARLSNHGELILEREAPRLMIGRVPVAPPPGAFLQATEAGEQALAACVAEAVGPARRVVDLFAGLGAFALRLAERAEVRAVELDRQALAALSKAARQEPAGLRPVATEARDLFRRPLAGAELEPFEAAVFDPPRAGAQAQAEALARSPISRVAAISCFPQTFARDAAILAKGGYRLERVVPIDQFRDSPHVEMVGFFRKAPVRRRAPLLG
jgi:23S rRNA (uracil1939-C5)-methyltransferase